MLPQKDPNCQEEDYIWKKADTIKVKSEALTYQMQFLEKYSLLSFI